MDTWAVIYRTAWVILVAIAIATVARLFYPKWIEYREVQEEQALLEEDIRLKEELIKRYRYKQERFKNDPRFVERMAHEAGLAKDNEIIFRLEKGGAEGEE